MNVRIDQKDYPRKQGEYYWMVHPNQVGCEFCVPYGAMTCCIEDFEQFRNGTMYGVVETDKSNGIVGVMSGAGIIYEMPQYIFARHFDAEAFVRGVPTKEEQCRIHDIVSEEFKG